jgi:DNA-binding NtrC family response regulator
MPTVLVVEDDTLIPLQVIEELERAGSRSSKRATPTRLSGSRSPAGHPLVFTDIDMPGSMDGLKLAAAVRDRWPPVHIIITTGKTRPSEIPANALFIPKPYLGNAVVAAMRTFENMGPLPEGTARHQRRFDSERVGVASCVPKNECCGR